MSDSATPKSSLMVNSIVPAAAWVIHRCPGTQADC